MFNRLLIFLLLTIFVNDSSQRNLADFLVSERSSLSRKFSIKVQQDEQPGQVFYKSLIKTVNQFNDGFFSYELNNGIWETELTERSGRKSTMRWHIEPANAGETVVARAHISVAPENQQIQVVGSKIEFFSQGVSSSDIQPKPLKIKFERIESGGTNASISVDAIEYNTAVSSEDRVIFTPAANAENPEFDFGAHLDLVRTHENFFLGNFFYTSPKLPADSNLQLVRKVRVNNAVKLNLIKGRIPFEKKAQDNKQTEMQLGDGSSATVSSLDFDPSLNQINNLEIKDLKTESLVSGGRLKTNGFNIGFNSVSGWRFGIVKITNNDLEAKEGSIEAQINAGSSINIGNDKFKDSQTGVDIQSRVIVGENSKLTLKNLTFSANKSNESEIFLSESNFDLKNLGGELVLGSVGYLKLNDRQESSLNLIISCNQEPDANTCEQKGRWSKDGTSIKGIINPAKLILDDGQIRITNENSAENTSTTSIKIKENSNLVSNDLTLDTTNTPNLTGHFSNFRLNLQDNQAINFFSQFRIEDRNILSKIQISNIKNGVMKSPLARQGNEFRIGPGKNYMQGRFAFGADAALIELQDYSRTKANRNISGLFELNDSTAIIHSFEFSGENETYRVQAGTNSFLQLQGGKLEKNEFSGEMPYQSAPSIKKFNVNIRDVSIAEGSRISFTTGTELLIKAGKAADVEIKRLNDSPFEISLKKFKFDILSNSTYNIPGVLLLNINGGTIPDSIRSNAGLETFSLIQLNDRGELTNGNFKLVTQYSKARLGSNLAPFENGQASLVFNKTQGNNITNIDLTGDLQLSHPRRYKLSLTSSISGVINTTTNGEHSFTGKLNATMIGLEFPNLKTQNYQRSGFEEIYSIDYGVSHINKPKAPEVGIQIVNSTVSHDPLRFSTNLILEVKKTVNEDKQVIWKQFADRESTCVIREVQIRPEKSNLNLFFELSLIENNFLLQNIRLVQLPSFDVNNNPKTCFINGNRVSGNSPQSWRVSKESIFGFLQNDSRFQQFLANSFINKDSAAKDIVGALISVNLASDLNSLGSPMLGKSKNESNDQSLSKINSNKIDFFILPLSFKSRENLAINRNSLNFMENSAALLITYPDYPVNTDSFYGYTTMVGHAGVLLIKHDGRTKYYEFGRYNGNMNGEVRNQTITNAEIGSDGRATRSSLKNILAQLSAKSGRNGRIRAAYFIKVDFDKMLAQATAKQEAYTIASFNCGRYAETVILKGNPKIDKPLIINPTPNNIVDEYIEEGNAEVLFSPATGEISIGAGDESDAKIP
jgi:hypothetical protein